MSILQAHQDVLQTCFSSMNITNATQTDLLHELPMRQNSNHRVNLKRRGRLKNPEAVLITYS